MSDPLDRYIEIYRYTVPNKEHLTNLFFELLNYFNFETKMKIINTKENKVIIDIAKQYYEKVNEELIPIQDICNHRGNVYDDAGNLVLNAGAKIRLTYPISLIVKRRDEECIKILKRIFELYHSIVRKYDCGFKIANVLPGLKPEILANIKEDNEYADDMGIILFKIVDKYFPGLTSCVTELCTTEYGAYAILDKEYTGTDFIVSVIGDNRVAEYYFLKRKVKELKEELESLKR